mmetsp:Transcript_28471/g.66144  ORF Transcript_28471/g.66144 Transcript_28471/m.66144 type:complete len:85 (-) Transcript_28471:456-710(-)
MWSAIWVKSTLCEINSMVLPCMVCFMLRRMLLAVCVSMAEKQSSSTKIFGVRIRALAMAIRCLCPPESVIPRSPNIVSICWGNC